MASEPPKFVKCIYPFIPEGDGEIHLFEGDILELYDENEEWWAGKKDDGTKGWFPKTFVQAQDVSATQTNYIKQLPKVPASEVASSPTVTTNRGLPNTKRRSRAPSMPEIPNFLVSKGSKKDNRNLLKKPLPLPPKKQLNEARPKIFLPGKKKLANSTHIPVPKKQISDAPKKLPTRPPLPRRKSSPSTAYPPPIPVRVKKEPLSTSAPSFRMAKAPTFLPHVPPTPPVPKSPPAQMPPIPPVPNNLPPIPNVPPISTANPNTELKRKTIAPIETSFVISAPSKFQKKPPDAILPPDIKAIFDKFDINSSTIATKAKGGAKKKKKRTKVT